MSARTPGPWRVVQRRAGGPLHVMSEYGQYVMDGSNQRESRIRNPADASLIAAAPDLLEALEYIIRGVPDTWEGVQRARAAIAKAKGEA